jgi:hypothetical protein
MKTMIKRFTGILLAAAGVLIFSLCEPATGPESGTGLTFTLADPESQSVAANATGVFRIAIKNNEPSPVSFTCIKNADPFPDASWSASICIGVNCFSPLADSVDGGPLAVGATDTCSVDVQTGAGGSAQVHFKIYSKEDPAQSYENTFTCAVVNGMPEASN